MTPIYGVTGEHKRTGRDRRAQPRVVVYDSDLTAALPPRVVASSGLNALAHAVAVLLTSDGDPIAQLHAEEAARRLMTALPLAVNPAEPAARDNTMFGAFLAAGALATLGAPGWHHRLCHIIGGTHRLVHADVHAVLLPRTIAFDHDRGAPGIAHLAAALGTSDPGGAVAALARDVGAPASLAELGLGPDALPGLVDRVGAELFPHSSVDRRRVEQLLSDAFAGRPAAPDAARHSSTQHPAS